MKKLVIILVKAKYFGESTFFTNKNFVKLPKFPQKKQGIKKRHAAYLFRALKPLIDMAKLILFPGTCSRVRMSEIILMVGDYIIL